MRTDRATTRIESLCEGVIEAAWLMALGTVLLVVNTASERSYEPDKAALVRSLAILAVAAWGWKMVAGGRFARPWLGRRPAAAVPALAAAWAVLVIVGSVLSVDPRLSWLGSYARAQGALTELAYLVFFAAILAHLRSEAQWRRIALVLVVAGTAAALYGIAQALGLDPVSAMKPVDRVHSTAGNAIFLGASLLMTVFVTALEAARAVDQGRPSGSNRRPPGRLRATVLSLACACQLAALVLTQSRGPFLGLLAGLYVASLVLLLRARSVGAERDWRASRWRRWLVPAVLAAVLLGVLLVAAVNRPATGLSAVRGLPYIGRLSSVLDPSSRTLRVRLLIWRAAADRLASDEPLAAPGGEPDRLRRSRPLIGYGPDAFGLAVDRFVPAELGRVEDRGRFPDRAHNDVFDRLLMNGLAGALIWLATWAALVALALGRLGLVGSRRERLALWLAMAAGAAAGAVAPWLASGDARLSGAGLSVGLVLSVAVFITFRVLLRAPPWSSGAATPADFGLTVALVATLIAHLVELQVGIAITFTRLAFWCLAGVLVVVAGGGVGPQAADGNAGRTGSGRGGDGRRLALVTGLLAVALCLPWLLLLTVGGGEARRVGRILALSWWGPDGSVHPTILFWLTAATLALASLMSSAAGASRAGWRRHAVAEVAILGGFAVAQAALVAGAAADGRVDPVNAVGAAAAMYGWLTWVLIAVAVGLGVGMATSSEGSSTGPGRGVLAKAASALLLAALAVAAIQRTSVDPIRADGLLKPARALAASGRAETALKLLAQARKLAPSEPMYALAEGRAALAAADAVDAGERDRLFDVADASLEAARDLAPLDPDHWANLARCAAQRAQTTSSPDERGRLLQRAGRHYAAALALRPSWVVLLNELGRLLVHAGQTEEGERVLRHAVELDPEYVDPRMALAAQAARRAASAARAGRRETALRQLERALAEYEQVVALDPELEAAREAAAGVAAELSRRLGEAPDAGGPGPKSDRR